MNVHILGDSKGLGKHLYENFAKDGYNVIGYSRENGINLEENTGVVDKIEDNSLVVLNSYLNGKQLDFFKVLLRRPSVKVVICGSISARYFDNERPKYSKIKHELEKKFFDRAVYDPNKLLLLNLTGHAVENPVLIYKTILFWLENDGIIEVSFKKRQ